MNLEEVQRLEEVLAHHAAVRPDAPALEGARGSFTYGALWQAVEAQAQALRALGLQAGDRAVLVGENSPELVVAFFAALRCGAWAVNTSARLAAPELQRVIVHAQPRVVLFLECNSPETTAHADTLRAEDRLPAAAGGWRVLTATPSAESQAAAAPHAAQVATLIYTSGTTGTPKSAMLTHGNLLYIARTLSEGRRYTPADRAYCVSPLSHVGGLAALLCTVLYAGASVLLPRRFAPADLADAIDRRGLTVVPGVPPLFVKFMEWVRATGWRPPAGRVRMISSSAGFFDPGVKRELEALFGLPLVNAYALTESTAGACQTPYGESHDAATSGVPLPGVDVRLANPATGLPPVADDEGELQLRGPNIFAGYFRDVEATRAVFTADGWFRTGDLGRIDAQGFVYVLSRLKDVIKRSGFNVYPADIEQLLNAHPDVALSAVVGRRVAYDEEIIAFVQPRPGAECAPEALRAWLDERIAAYKRPGRIVRLAEFPTLHNGKVDKVALHRSLAEATGNA